MDARKDSVHFYFSSLDPDGQKNAKWTFIQRTLDSVRVDPVSAGTYTRNFSIAPYAHNYGAIPCSLWIQDSLGWASSPFSFSINSINDIPRCSIVAIGDTTGAVTVKSDTLILDDSSFVSLMQFSDSTFVHIYFSDANDSDIAFSLYKNNVRIDTVFGDSQYVYKFSNTQLSAGFAKFDLGFFDPDTTIRFTFWAGVNHPPEIDSLRGPENSSSKQTASLKAQPGQTNRFIVQVNEPDLPFGDSLTFRWRLNNQLLPVNNDTVDVQLIPPTDTVLSLFVRDLAGKSDSVAFKLKYPFLSTNTTSFNRSLAEFKDSLSLILGGKTRDTVSITLKNLGTSQLIVRKIYTKINDARWLTYRLGNVFIVSENTQVSKIPEYAFPAGDSIAVSVYFRTDSMIGDGVASDTLFIETNDYLNPKLTIPVRMVYNDLPYVSSFKFDFQADTRLPKRTKNSARNYQFPPNAKLSFAFSEPVWDSSVRSGITIYSYSDSLLDRSLVPIAGSFAFSSTHDSATFTPAYTRRSPKFGWQPKAGLFISTDSIKVRVTNSIMDIAGNRLDVHKEKARRTYSDTTYSATVDSAPFIILSTTPDSGSHIGVVNAPIQVVFSRKIDSSSVDTSLSNNRTIRVRTRFSDGLPILFSSVTIDSNILSVKSYRAFFNDDSISITLAGNIRDMMGYTLESNHDGRPSSYYDSTDTSDTYQWHFFTEPTPFYIFPNPYKPNKDSRHRELGGIVFKNLNQLSSEGGQLDVRILSLKGTLLYSSLSAGADLSTREGQTYRPPQWVWNTRNQKGEELGSGLYYLVIKNTSGSIVHKGKIMIIR